MARVTIAPSIRKQKTSQKDKQRMREEESIVMVREILGRCWFHVRRSCQLCCRAALKNNHSKIPGIHWQRERNGFLYE